MNDVFTRVFASLPRQGPGSDICTRRALKLIQPLLPAAPAILDIGCGSGAQTLTLAKALPEARIIASDLSETLLQQLRQKADKAGYRHIETLQADMTALPCEAGSIDLIWSEGAIYLMGVAAGLQAWKRLLKPGACLAFSHISWLRESPSDEAKAFWQAAYPAITGRNEIRRLIAAKDFELLGDFALPSEAWWQDYYTPLEKALAALPPSEASFAAEQRREIELYREHCAEYGYVFYALRAV